MAKLIDMNRWREARAAADAPALVSAELAVGQGFHYWRGRSGRRYLHSIYTLFACPAIPQANYMLVHRGGDGSRSVLAVGQTTSDAASLNLARLRQEGARLGANEVHIHLLADSDDERDDVETDLRAQERGGPIPRAIAQRAIAI